MQYFSRMNPKNCEIQSTLEFAVENLISED